MANIQKLTEPYFVNGSTQLNAENLNPIIAKLNEVIDQVNSGVSPTPTQTVETPTISISGTTATIGCATAGATIYYTTNGNTPTTSSTQYSSPITLSGACTIKAIAVKSGMTNSEVASQSYAPASGIVISTAVDAGQGTISGGGNYEEGATVNLEATPASGYEFVSWGDAASNPRSVTASESKIYHGAFIPSGGTVISYTENQNHIQSLKSANSESAIQLSYVSANYHAAFYPITAGKKYEIVTKCLHSSVMVWGYCNSIPSSFPGSEDNPITIEGKMVSEQPTFVSDGSCGVTIDSAENYNYLVLIIANNDFYTKVKQMN